MADESTGREDQLMNTPENAMKMAIAFIVAVGLIGYFMLGFVGVPFTAAFIGGPVLWLLTTYRQPIEPWSIMFPYLVTVLALLVHVMRISRSTSRTTSAGSQEPRLRNRNFSSSQPLPVPSYGLPAPREW
jgi:hypothetical protein